MDVSILIMAGGHGTRFWPWSNELLPKQFLPLAHPEKTLLQQTYERVRELADNTRVMVLTNHEYIPIVKMQLPDLPMNCIVGEPMLRDTAAAIALGSELCERKWPETVQVVLPADHQISPDKRFQDIVSYAAECAANDNKLYTIGITPTRPSSAFGYLQSGEKLESPDAFNRSEVKAFVEKPDEQTAANYLAAGGYFWNAGMFIWSAKAIREAIARHLPVHAREIPEAVSQAGQPGFDAVLKEAFLKLPKISIDFGVMQAEGEQGNVRLVEGDFEWSDLGGWHAFSQTLSEDANGNRIYGQAMNWQDGKWAERFVPREPRTGDKDEDLSLGKVYTMDSNNNIVFNNRRGHRITLYGVDNMTVIHTHRDTLVVPRDKVDEIKPVVSAVPEMEHTGGRIEPQKVEKPWGWELWWAWSDDFAGKTLFLKKGKRFSLQYHVVKEEVIYVHEGRVKLETAARGEEMETSEITAGDAIYVEPGRLHRIEALEDSLLLESSLPFLWDVVRVADDFGREGTRNAEIKKS